MKRNGPEEIRARLEREQLERENRAFRDVMATPAGRLVMRALLYAPQYGRLEHLSYTGNSETYLLEGQRQVGLNLQNHLKDLAPEHYLLLQREHGEGIAAALLRARASANESRPTSSTETEEQNHG